jgi:hypothetical protein
MRELLEDLAAELRAAGDVDMGTGSDDVSWWWKKGYLTAVESISIDLDEILTNSSDS